MSLLVSVLLTLFGIPGKPWRCFINSSKLKKPNTLVEKKKHILAQGQNLAERWHFVSLDEDLKYLITSHLSGVWVYQKKVDLNKPRFTLV